MRYRFTSKNDGNLGLHVGDDPLHVKKNRERLKEVLGVSSLMFMDQVHGDDVVVISSTQESTPTCDAMITNLPNVGLAVMVADCMPLLFYDAPTQSIGVAHAGRKGNALHVSTKTIRAMCETFHARPESIEVYRGPSIGGCCYEVGKEAALGLEEALHVKQGRYFLDLPQANRDELLRAGIQEQNLHTQEVCTCCDERYFSYRKERITGRFAGVICL